MVKKLEQAKLEEYKDIARQAIIPEKYDEIMKDITRTYQEIEIFQDERTMEMLSRLLFLWCNRNMDYRQGMNEIMGVIFYAYDFQQFEEDQREADLYWMFDAIMTHHKRLFDYTSKTPLENTQIIKQYLQIMQKLKTIDSELYNVFQENKISSELFLIRYIKCLLSREFEIDQVLEIWDHIFQYGNRLQLLDCIIISMFIEVKQAIFEIEYINGFEVYLLFQNYPKKDKYMQIVSRATKIYCIYSQQLNFISKQNNLTNNPELQKYSHGSIQVKAYINYFNIFVKNNDFIYFITDCILLGQLISIGVNFKILVQCQTICQSTNDILKFERIRSKR
ncbi:TBC1 domain [Paramecium bursaria]